MRIAPVAGMMLVVGCTSQGDLQGGGAGAEDEGFEPPVLTNAESPVRYPPRLFRDRVEGTVVLRLFIDETGKLVPDSTRIAEGSGHPELDAAALDAVGEMSFAPARHDGRPVATPFLQPIHFQHPARSGSGP